MKLLTVSAATLVTALAAMPAAAAQCHSGQMSFEELIYSSKKELIDEYCLTKKVVKIYEPGPNAGISERRAYSDRLGACARYVGQIGRILKKEHGTASTEIICKE